MKVAILVILVVFTNCTQCSTVLPTNITYGLSVRESDALKRIIINQETTISANFDAFNPIFDSIEKYLSIIIYDLEDDYDITKVAEASTRVRAGIDSSLNAIEIALGDSSLPVKESRNEAYADTDNLFAVVGSALTLAASGNYPANRAQLGVYRNTVRDAFRSLIKSIYDVILTHLKRSDRKARDVFEQALHGSTLAVDHVAYALFNGIIIYAAAVTVGKADIRQIFEIEGYREDALFGIRSESEYTYSALKALYISSKLNQPQLIRGLNANQFSLTVGLYRFNEVIDAYFETILTHFKGVALGLQRIGQRDFSLVDVVKAKALAKLTAGYEVFLDSILITHSDVESAVTDARRTLSKISTAVISSVYDMIDVAQDPATTYSESLEIIKSFNETIPSLANSFVDTYCDLIRNGNTFNPNSETKFRILRDEAVNRLAVTVSYVLDGITILIKLVDADETSPSDLSEILTAKARAASALALFTYKISEADVIHLTASN